MNSIDLAIAAGELPPCEKEFRFCPGRRFRFDWCWKEDMVAAEWEGGSYVGGRHTRPIGYKNDCEKYSLAAAMGWCVIRFTTDQLQSGEALKWLKQAFALRRGQ